MAQSAHDFLVQHMRGSAGGLWHWNVSRQGQVLQPQQVLYGLFFVLYGFRCADRQGCTVSLSENFTDLFIENINNHSLLLLNCEFLAISRFYFPVHLLSWTQDPGKVHSCRLHQ